MHCHPWNTPPFDEVTNEKNSMIGNLPSELQYKKLSYLHETIRNNLGVESTSFRSGRWGYSHTVAKHIQSLGYIVDSSITPYISWKNYYGPDFSDTSPTPESLRKALKAKIDRWRVHGDFFGLTLTEIAVRNLTVDEINI